MILTHGANSLPMENGETVTIGGRKYPVVTINGTKWLAENLDYKWDGLLIDNDGDVSSPSASYYNHDEATYGVNGNRYGLLYNLEAQVYLSQNISALCPGCRMPILYDWDNLFNCGWPNLKSKTGWPEGYNGTDPYGVNIVPSGYYYYSGFENVGRSTFIRGYRPGLDIWTMINLYYNSDRPGSYQSTSNWWRLPIRLIVNT